MKILLKSLKALADGNRLRILRLLMDRPRCVCELQAALGDRPAHRLQALEHPGRSGVGG